MWKEEDTPLVAGFESDQIGWLETLGACGGVVLLIMFVVMVGVAAFQRFF